MFSKEILFPCYICCFSICKIILDTLRRLIKEFKTSRFEIRPKNQEGLPEAPDVMSEIMLPKKAALISTPQYFKVISYPGSNTTTYMVRWRLPEHKYVDQNIETATFYWCKQSEYENRCQVSFNLSTSL